MKKPLIEFTKIYINFIIYFFHRVLLYKKSIFFVISVKYFIKLGEKRSNQILTKKNI